MVKKKNHTIRLTAKIKAFDSDSEEENGFIKGPITSHVAQILKRDIF